MKKTPKVKYAGEATLRQIRLSPQRARLVVNMIRGRQVERALSILMFSPTKGAKIVHKLLNSAVANAREHGGADVDKLWVTHVAVDTAVTLKRIMARAHGRADTRLRRASNISIGLGER